MASVKMMDMNKPSAGSSLSESSSRSIRFGFSRWFHTLKKEIREINWTSFAELKVYTQLVVAATFIFGLTIYIVDLFIQFTLTIMDGLVSSLAHWIGG